MTGLSAWVHELVIAPLAFGLAWLHASRALGARRAALELVALALYGFALELVAMLVFTSHVYGAGWRLDPLGVPLAVAAVWAAVISSAMALAARLGLRSAAARGAGAALIGIVLDLLMEPVAVRAGLWEWTPPGPWLGVPIGNFVGWGIIVASYTIGAERWHAGDGVLGPATRRLVLAALSIAVLVLVGLVWTRLGAERLFAGGRGWLAWAAVLIATAAIATHARSRRAAPGSAASLAARLASAGGLLPAAVLLLVASAFAADAALLESGTLALVALASLAVLALVAHSTEGTTEPT